VCARLGGDEFVVLCVDTEPHQADAIADRLRAAVAEPFTVDGHTIEITAAVGVGATGVPRTARVDANGLIRQADERMYEAKRRRP
jgi:diguanylate cyclase (GGDEF)-like protein